MGVTIGVLGLQGDFALHQQSLNKIGAEAKIVRSPHELKGCSGLVLPGGESTTFVNLLKKTGMFEAIRRFHKTHALMGTCAGLITLATNIVGNTMETLELIDIQVERNAFGRQVDSFVDTVTLGIFKDKPEFEGVFIRAPRIRALGKGTDALGYYQNEIVMARNQNVLVMTFHPELTEDTRIHEYFVREMVGKMG
jgi:5'-phosphate synthase pdxT subunit